MGLLRPAARALALAGCAAALAAAADAATAPTGAVREHLEVLARQLEAAVARVSPAAQILTGQVESTQALRVEGVGVVFVLPARALPLPRRPASVRGRIAEQQQRQQLERPAPGATAPPRVATIVPTPEPPALRTPLSPPGLMDLEELERQLAREIAVREQLMRELVRARFSEDVRLQRALELQMLAVHEQADVFRVQVERVRQALEQQVLIQLGPRDRPRPEVSPEAAAPAPGGPAGPESSWQAWLGSMPPETSEANQVLVEQVEQAIISALEANGGEVALLDPHEGVTVAVDFVGAGSLALRTRLRCTLVLRVPAGDVAARAAGTLSAGEFRGRVLSRPYSPY